MDEEWFNIPYDSVLGARNLNCISVNPSNTNEVYISSFYDGLLLVNGDMPEILYGVDNSPLEPENPTSQVDIRLGATVFDNQGVLWTSSGRVEHPLKAFNSSSGQWQVYSFSNIISDVGDDWGYSDIVVDQSGTKWLGNYLFGVIGFNESNGIISNRSILEGQVSNIGSFI